MDKRREGCITPFCQKFCLKVPGTFVGDTFWFSEKNRVSKNFRQKKGISIFCANNFLSRRVQKLRGGTRLCFRKLLVSKNVMDKRRGVCITIFCQKLCLTVLKIFVGEPSFVSENFGYRKFLWIREEEVYHNFLSNFLSHSTEKFRRATLLCFKKFLVSKNVMDKRRWGVSHFLIKTFVSQYRKSS